MMETLPCGCVLDTGPLGEFVYTPCSRACRWYAYVVEEAARQGTPLVTEVR